MRRLQKKLLGVLAALFLLASPTPASAQISCINFYNGATFLGCQHVFKADGTTFTCSQTGGIVTCSSAGGGGTIGGTIAATQVAFGSAANTIAGSNNLTWDNTNQLFDVTGSVNTSSNFMGAQTSTSQAASNIGACRFNTSNHWECSENNGSYFQVILATTTSDITWTNAANHSLLMQAAGTDTVGINFTINSGSAGTVSAAGGKAGGTLTLAGAAGVAGTAGQAAGAGGPLAFTSGAGGANGGGGGAAGGAINFTLGASTGAAGQAQMIITGTNNGATGPLNIVGTATSTSTVGVTMDAATNMGGRKYTIASTGTSAGAGASKFVLLDNTAALYRWALDSSGNWGNISAIGAGAALNMNNNNASPPSTIYSMGGNIELDTLTTPGLPNVTVNGTPGATTCTYYTVALDRYGHMSLPGTARTVNNCAATLNGINNNTITISASTNLSVYQFDIIRSAGGPSQGLIATVSGNVTTNTVDNGLASSVWTDPVYNNTGDIVLAGTSSNGSVVTAKVVSKGSAPANTPGVGAGTGPTIAVTGNDQAGQISVTAGTTPTAASVVLTLTYNAQYSAAPQAIIMQPTNLNAAGVFNVTFVSSNTQPSWAFTSTLVQASVYTWDYHVIW